MEVDATTSDRPRQSYLYRVRIITADFTFPPKVRGGLLDDGLRVCKRQSYKRRQRVLRQSFIHPFQHKGAAAI